MYCGIPVMQMIHFTPFFFSTDSAPAYRPPGMRGREPKVQMHTYEPPSNQKNQPEQEKKQLSKNQKRKLAKVGS